MSEVYIKNTLCPCGRLRMIQLLRILENGRLDPTKMTTHTFAFDEIERVPHDGGEARRRHQAADHPLEQALNSASAYERSLGGCVLSGCLLSQCLPREWSRFDAPGEEEVNEERKIGTKGKSERKHILFGAP